MNKNYTESKRQKSDSLINECRQYRKEKTYACLYKIVLLFVLQHWIRNLSSCYDNAHPYIQRLPRNNGIFNNVYSSKLTHSRQEIRMGYSV